MTMDRVLVIGLGNPLMGDDGIGPAAIVRLQEEELPGEVDLLDAGTPGLALLDLWHGYRRVWLIDAVLMGHEAGSLCWFSAADVEKIPEERVEAHGSVSGALRLALELNQLPEDFRLLAVQPERVSPGLSMTLAAQRGVDGVVQEIRRCLEAVD